ncbi:hypothetical protein NPIL_509781 [Nephila pilipes]|uniref:Uncharacterized protein n=1 Tax=Nephila pilipes TaxID=299642 RepID=A0A8X6TCA4_NEPPI|nr:hypothetical protein NPIL_509781 [Nephila pilipes]
MVACKEGIPSSHKSENGDQRYRLNNGREEWIIKTRLFNNIFGRKEQSLDDERNYLEESEMFKNQAIEGAFQILVRWQLHCNNEKFRKYFRLTVL